MNERQKRNPLSMTLIKQLVVEHTDAIADMMLILL